MARVRTQRGQTANRLHTSKISRMTQRFDVCIRGGGIVGSTLALLLSQQRLRVALCVKPPQASAGPDGHSDIRAYALNAASRRLLETVRAWPDTPSTAGGASPVTPVNRMCVSGDQGGQLVFDADAAGEPSLNWIVDVPALEARLADALRYQGHVHIFNGDEPLPTCALTVICEGRRSATRAEWGMTYDVTPYPHHAVAARLTLAQPHDGVARQWFSNGEILALLPLGGEHGADVALVWSVPADKAAQLQHMDASTFVDTLAQVCGMEPAALTLTHAPQSWPLELSQASEWVKPGVALAGDAAHAMHPLAGQGLNVGLGDVAELNRVLQGREYWRDLGDIKLLRKYERSRKTAFATMGLMTDGLFNLFHTDNRLLQNLRNMGLNGVDKIALIKSWLTRQATGSHGVD